MGVSANVRLAGDAETRAPMPRASRRARRRAAVPAVGVHRGSGAYNAINRARNNP